MALRNQLLQTLKERIKSPNFWFEWFIISLFLLTFAPVSYWFAENTFSETRVIHSLITLSLAIILLYRFESPILKNALEFNAHCQKSLKIAFFLLLVFVLNKACLDFFQLDSFIINMIHSLSIIASMVMALSSLVFFIFGTQIARINYSSSITFILFLFLSLFMIQVDWPLRALAAEWSVFLIELLGQSVDFFIANQDQGPNQSSIGLIIQYNGKNFNVASECNGFGIILNCALIGLLLSVCKRHNFFNSITNIMAALFIGFTFNVLRIISIILIAPFLFQYYDFIHELLGTIYYWGAFFITWYLLKGPLEKQRNG
ncbi:MAG: archaeosortase/exosortase family protein [Coraliomargaritaceae bacterium]